MFFFFRDFFWEEKCLSEAFPTSSTLLMFLLERVSVVQAYSWVHTTAELIRSLSSCFHENYKEWMSLRFQFSWNQSRYSVFTGVWKTARHYAHRSCVSVWNQAKKQLKRKNKSYVSWKSYLKKKQHNTEHFFIWIVQHKSMEILSKQELQHQAWQRASSAFSLLRCETNSVSTPRPSPVIRSSW